MRSETDRDVFDGAIGTDGVFPHARRDAGEVTPGSVGELGALDKGAKPARKRSEKTVNTAAALLTSRGRPVKAFLPHYALWNRFLAL